MRKAEAEQISKDLSELCITIRECTAAILKAWCYDVDNKYGPRGNHITHSGCSFRRLAEKVAPDSESKEKEE